MNFALIQQGFQLRFVQPYKGFCHAAPEFQFIRLNILAFIFGKTVNKNSATLRVKRHQNSESSPAPLTGARNALLDQASAEIGVDEAEHRATYGFAQLFVAYAFAPGIPGKLF